MLIDKAKEPLDFHDRKLISLVTLRLVGIPRELERLHVKIGNFVQRQCVVGTCNALVVAAPSADGFNGEFADAN